MGKHCSNVKTNCSNLIGTLMERINYKTILYMVTGLLMIIDFIVLENIDFLYPIRDFLDTVSYLYNACPWFLLFLGVLLVGLSIIYGFDVAKKWFKYLKWFVDVVDFIMEMMVMTGAGYIAEMVKDNLENVMVYQVQNNYFNDTSDDVYSVAWNRMQGPLECCGAVDYRDYINSSYSLSYNQPVPFSCCKGGDGSNLTTCLEEALVTQNPICKDQQPTVGNWTQLNPCGCYAPVYDIGERAFILWAFPIVFSVWEKMIMFGVFCIKVRYCNDNQVEPRAA